MIPHHAQAKEMSALAEGRTNNPTVLAVAERITLSQDDEISMMQGWLRDQGLEVPADDVHHQPGFERMKGMLSDEQMEELAAASGPEFDRLYLESMIDHHQGALEMVEMLLDQRGSAQDPLLYEFTSDVTSDQTSEIERMDTLLASFNPDPRVGLAAGFRDAGEASLNMEVVASLPKPAGFFEYRRGVCKSLKRKRRLRTAMPRRRRLRTRRRMKTPIRVRPCLASLIPTCFLQVTIWLPETTMASMPTI
jgi:uncharacterized protein (DUF305 family)